MMQPTTSSLRLLALGALLALPLAGCDNKAGEARNEAEEQLQSAADKIQTYTMQAAYPTPMTDEQSDSLTTLAEEVNAGNTPEGMTDEQARSITGLGRDRFQPISDAKTELKGIQDGLSSGGGNGGLSEQQTASAALRAETNLGLARLYLEEANRSDASLQNAISLAGAHIDAILELQAIVAANAAYDPSSPLRQIDSQAQDARSRLSQYQATVRETQKRITDLQARIDAEVRETNRLGEQAATQREAALSAPLDTRIAKIEAAAAIAREADGHQVTAAGLEAQVDVLKPELARAQTYVLQAEGELKDLDAARARIKARQQEVAAEGTRLQSELRQAIENFTSVFTPLESQFENELGPLYDAAREAAEAALRDARSAGSQRSRSAKAQQAIGQILWRESMSIESFAQLVHRVADHGQALGRSGQDSAIADALDARAKEARDAAEAALKEALDAIPESGGSGSDAEANQNLATMIRQSLEYITGQSVAEVRDLTELAESVPTVPDEPVDTGDSPLGLLQRAKAIMEEGRYEEVPSLVLARTPAQQTALDASRRISEATTKLNAASKARFGVGLDDLMKDPRFASQMSQLGESGAAANVLPFLLRLFQGGLPDLSDIDLETVTFSYDNSRSTAWTDDIPALAGLNFVLSDGQWYFEAPSAPEGIDRMAELFFNPIAAAMDEIATATADGEFVDQWIMVGALMDEIVKKQMEARGTDPGGVGRQRNRNDGGGGG